MESAMQLKRYLPLFILVLMALLGALAVTWGRSLDWHSGSAIFMGLLFLLFAMLKLFNISGFADGFQKYDLIGKNSRLYAYSYPFIELGLGLAYLAGRNLPIVNLITVIVTAIGAVGVLIALKKGLDVRCACMGTVLDVPLSTVTLTEDLGMGLMALLMLLA